jgi:benzaldehyde dehydrogenase (NAD)
VATKVGFLDLANWQACVFNGDWQRPTGGSVEVIEPATGAVLTVAGMANAHDVGVAAKAAAQAQRLWQAMPPRERADVFRRAAAVLQENIEELGLWIARETGSLVLKGQHEVREAITLLHLAAGKPLEAQGLVLPSTPGRLSYARRVPHGVVGVISPFNFPLILSLRAVAPALAYGNAVVLKPDPQTPVTGGFIIARAFELAGLPKGLLQVLPGGAEAGEALCSDPEIGMIAFTGSTGVGRRVGELAGKNLKRVSLELGGKSSLIVLDDADLELAASNVAWGAWLHQGQICMAAGRILVQESVAADLTRILAEKAQHLPVGDPAKEQVALGPIINAKQLQRVHGIVSDSVAAGAKLEAGGSYEGLFYRPTVLSGVKPGMRAFDEEVFGPVVNITTFANDDEAVELANATSYGLAAGVISKSVGRAMAVGGRLSTGMLHINDQTVADDCVNPFGGRGCSGNGGSVGGPADIDEFTQWQWVTVQDAPNRYPF